jgi:uncharacterized protein YgbK (DUF1537 family)
MSPEEMNAELIPKFKALRTLGAPFVHYKICSTFDSSPTVGSVGHAIDIGYDVFNPPLVPLMVGAPFLRRYVVFSNLFARVGDTTYRLDRHPTMSKHPITPMNESDLRLHLSKQTARKIGSVDLWHMSQSEEELDNHLASLRSEGAEIVLFDTLDEKQMLQIGRMIWGLRGSEPVFLVGSSGIEFALGMYLEQEGVLKKPGRLESPGKSDQLLVISGSCAPGTAEQIEWALKRGFVGLRLNASRLVDPDSADREREKAVREALGLLESQKRVVLYSALGPDDPAIVETKNHMKSIGAAPETVGHRLGTQQGLILKELIEKSDLSRVCVAGGDTCGYATKQLGIYALEMRIPVAPGAPLCLSSSDTERFDRLEISLKGGQNGNKDYFGRILFGLQADDPIPE